MGAAFEDLFAVDRLVHEPARLAILTILEACECADFLFLASATGLPNGNVSGHLAKLQAVGLVTMTKGYRGKRPHTLVSLTPTGLVGIREYWRRLDRARKTADLWRILAPSRIGV
jgi:DNA-binding transcriptional ArsR family regulator